MQSDFMGANIENTCLACIIGNKTYSPPGGILFEDDFFFVHQDPYVAIPGFFIISTKRHIYSMSELTVQEQVQLGRVISIVEQVVKKVTNVENLTVIQEDKVCEGHFHIWVFPWHSFIVDKYPYSLNIIRTVIEEFKTNRNYVTQTIEVAQKALEQFIPYNELITDFHGLNLIGTDFSNHPNLREANFEGAILKRCHFDGCDLSFANFNNADLYSATFKDAVLYSTTFKNADLTRSDFSSAHLYGVKIFTADMTRTVFDPIVQEEKWKDYPKAEDIYNTIKRAFAENGNKEESAKYYYRQCVVKRKQMRGLPRFINWLFADVIVGYGERLTRCLGIAFFIILFFAVLFYYLTGIWTTYSFFQCLVNSFSIFFGFERPFKFIGKPIKDIIFIAEQIIGYTIIAMSAICMTRKIVRD